MEAKKEKTEEEVVQLRQELQDPQAGYSSWLKHNLPYL